MQFIELKRNYDIIESYKEEILQRWLSCFSVQEKLKNNGLKTEFFGEHFGIKVIEYALGVINSKNALGDCPVMGVMLFFFKKRKIPLGDIAIICLNLKNSIVGLLLEKGLLTPELLAEISILIDYNFEGVVNGYVALYYKDYKPVEESFKKPTLESLSHTKSEEDVDNIQNVDISLENSKSVTATEYLSDLEADFELISELGELESETLETLSTNEILTESILNESTQLFIEYAKALNMMYDFEELAYTVTILSDELTKAELQLIDEDVRSSVLVYLNSIINDLKQWREAVFINQDADDIHYLDKTLLSSIEQLQMVISPSDDGADEIEFF